MRAIERLENPLAIRAGTPSACILDDDARVLLGSLDANSGGAARMHARVLEQVAHQPAQQHRIGLDGHRVAAHLEIEVRGFFGRERQQVHRLRALDAAAPHRAGWTAASRR